MKRKRSNSQKIVERVIVGYENDHDDYDRGSASSSENSHTASPNQDFTKAIAKEKTKNGRGEREVVEGYENDYSGPSSASSFEDSKLETLGCIDGEELDVPPVNESLIAPRQRIVLTSTIQTTYDQREGEKHTISLLEKIIRMMLYSYNEEGIRSGNNIRSNCAKGRNLNQKQFKKVLRHLCTVNVYDRVPIGSGRFAFKLTETGEKIAKKIKFLLETDPDFKFLLEKILGMPTTYDFGGQGWKNNWMDTS